MKLKVVDFEETVHKARKLVEEKSARGRNADEFVGIGEADGFKVYVAAGKSVKDTSPNSFHENPKDVFMLVLEGEMEFTFENMEKITVRKGQCLVLQSI